MKGQDFARLTAFDYVRDYGLKNAKANLQTYYNGDLVFIVPADQLEDLRRIVASVELVEKEGGLEKSLDKYEHGFYTGKNDQPRRHIKLGRAIKDCIQVFNFAAGGKTCETN